MTPVEWDFAMMIILGLAVLAFLEFARVIP